MTKVLQEYPSHYYKAHLGLSQYMSVTVYPTLHSSVHVTL